MGWWKADPVPEQTSVLNPPTSPPSINSIPASSSSACPVDSKSRSVWLQQAQRESQPTPVPVNDASVCPVDSKTREIWLKQAQAKSKQSSLPPTHPPIATKPTESLNEKASRECSSDRISQDPSTDGPPPKYKTSRPLSHEREISTIPRAQPDNNTGKLPSNSESETGYSKATGNWIYPSESQFFQAVMRKQTASDPKMLATSISSIIPIHNAVNERAWSMIKSWEGNTSSSCGGPKLLSFQGLGAGALSPRAKMKSWMGYTEPFDRHDWIVERCGGEKVEYVIDFYQGKQPEGIKDMGNLNFYLDVRPKLNSIEGCKLRLERFVGWR